MSDGLNDVRALRIAQIMSDTQANLNQVATISSEKTTDSQNLLGGLILTKIQSETQALLGSKAPSFEGQPDADDQTKTQLQEILLDAACRRFVAWRLYQRSVCVVRWFQRRKAILQGQEPSAQHAGALHQIDQSLRSEINAVTDSSVFRGLHAKDEAAGHWIAEMPTLSQTQHYVQANLQH